MPGNELVLYEERDGVALVTVNNPAKMNALSGPVYDGILEILDAVGSDSKVRAVIFTGVGKTFVSGADLEEFPKENVANARAFLRKSIAFFKRLEEVSKPVISAVNGYALGGGTEFTLYSDIVIASEKAVFGFPESGLGIVPAFGLLRLHQLVGRHKAKELMMTADRLTAQEALRIGLVNQVVPPEQLLDAAFTMANKIKEKAPLSVEIIKSAVNRELGGDDFTYLLDAVSMFFGTKDLKEGMTAFMEKRRPDFAGC